MPGNVYQIHTAVKGNCVPDAVYQFGRSVHNAHMPNRVVPRFKKKQYRRTFLREWRNARDLTLEQAAERIGELTGEGLTHGQLSRIERGEQPYSQAILEAAAEVYMTDPASLLMRNPADAGALWSIWDQAKPGERRMIEEIAATVVKKTGT